MERTYTIPDVNRADLEKDLGRAAKRAAKLGVEFGYRFGERRLEERDMDPGNPLPASARLNGKVAMYVVDVTLTGESPKLAGWAVAGVVNDLPDNGTITRTLPGFDLPEGAARRDAHWCDHCQAIRGRKTTYLLQHSETGEVKQVGTSCLKDFTGSDDPFKHAHWAEFLMTLDDMLGDEDGWFRSGDREPAMQPTVDFMGHVVHLAHLQGFVSGREAWIDHTQSTATEAWFNGWNRKLDDRLVPTGEDEEEAARLVAWARERYPEATEEMSDYIYNLAKVVQTSMVTEHTRGLLGSLYRHYEREMEIEAERKRTPKVLDEHMGVVGKRGEYDLLILGATVTEGYYGPTVVVKLTDLDGRRAVWFGSGNAAWELHDRVGETVHVKATVKAHEVYREHAETILNRVALVA